MKYNKMCQFAINVCKSVPTYYYHLTKHGINIESNDFTWNSIPVINKEEMVAYGENINPQYYSDYISDRLLRTRTSGSDGKYMEIFWNEKDYTRSMLSLWIYRLKWYGIHTDDRFCYFFTNDIDKQKYRYINNQMGICKTLLNNDDLEEVYKRIIEWNPVWMSVQPSTMVLLYQFIKNNGLIKPQNLKYIEFSGEVLPSEFKKEISEFFDCLCANQYGANEVNSIAYECPYGNMHVMSRNVFVEIVDENNQLICNSNEPCKKGITENGKIIITSLNNKVMPLIRYEIGDKGKLHKCNGCGCGCNSDILALSSGRANDYVFLSKTKRCTSYVFVAVLDKVNYVTDGAVKQFYIEQLDIGKFFIRIYKNVELPKELFIDVFTKLINVEELKNAEYIFEFTKSSFPVESNGKFMYFKNRCKGDS